MASQSVTNVRIHDNYIQMVSATQNAINIGSSGMTGVISDIQIPTGVINVGCSLVTPNLILKNIDGTVIQCSNNNGIASTVSMGRYVAYPVADTTGVTQNRGVCFDATPSVATCTTSQSTFIGFAVSTKGTNVSTGMYYAAGQVGTEVPSWPTDGAWTAGHYGILSTTTGGELHDGGTSPPASGSYVLFLNTGGSAGNADVLVLKTF